MCVMVCYWQRYIVIILYWQYCNIAVFQYRNVMNVFAQVWWGGVENGHNMFGNLWMAPSPPLKKQN